MSFAGIAKLICVFVFAYMQNVGFLMTLICAPSKDSDYNRERTFVQYDQWVPFMLNEYIMLKTASYGH